MALYHIPSNSQQLQSTRYQFYDAEKPTITRASYYLFLIKLICFPTGDSHHPVHPYAFLPFSVGPYSCVGSKFAMVEMKAVLSTLIQQFVFEEIPGFTVKPVIGLTTKPDPPLRLTIRPLSLTS